MFFSQVIYYKIEKPISRASLSSFETRNIMANGTFAPNVSTIDLPCKFLVATSTLEKINAFIVAVVTVLITISVLITNAIVLYVFIVKLRKYKNVSDLLLISLVSCDLATGIFIHPVVAYSWFLQSTVGYTCGFTLVYNLFGGFVLTNISIAIILFITIDVYWSIVTPYSERWSIKTCFTILVTIWNVIIITFSLFAFVFPTTYWVALQSSNSAIGIICYVFMFICHYRLNTEVKRMEDNRNSSFSDTNPIRKMLKLSTSVLSAIGLCFVPILLYSISRTIVGDSIVFVYLRPWCFFATLMNQLFDPIIYCIRLDSVRQEVAKLFCCKNRVGVS